MARAEMQEIVPQEEIHSSGSGGHEGHCAADCPEGEGVERVQRQGGQEVEVKASNMVIGRRELKNFLRVINSERREIPQWVLKMGQPN